MTAMMLTLPACRLDPALPLLDPLLRAGEGLFLPRPARGERVGRGTRRRGEA